MSEQDIKDLTDAISNDIDDWVRAGGGTYEELAVIVEQAIRRIAERGSE
jgi:hypothetical protein